MKTKSFTFEFCVVSLEILCGSADFRLYSAPWCLIVSIKKKVLVRHGHKLELSKTLSVACM